MTRTDRARERTGRVNVRRWRKLQPVEAIPTMRKPNAWPPPECTTAETSAAPVEPASASPSAPGFVGRLREAFGWLVQMCRGW